MTIPAGVISFLLTWVALGGLILLAWNSVPTH
jgi:hypothetical protein